MQKVCLATIDFTFWSKRWKVIMKSKTIVKITNRSYSRNYFSKRCSTYADREVSYTSATYRNEHRFNIRDDVAIARRAAGVKMRILREEGRNKDRVHG